MKDKIVIKKFEKTLVKFLIFVGTVASVFIFGTAAAEVSDGVGRRLSVEITYENECVFKGDFDMNPLFLKLCEGEEEKWFDKMAKSGFSAREILDFAGNCLGSEITAAVLPVQKTMRNASVSFHPERAKKFEFFPDQTGVQVDFFTLSKFVLSGIPSGVSKFELPVEKIPPATPLDDLKRNVEVRSVFGTDYSSSSPARKRNVELATSLISGTVVEPGERFSFNATVGARTAKRGFKDAKVILNGEYVEGVGGGVCQVSTTLYNAVLRAGLSVVKVAPHSLPPSYVKAGLDAMVSESSDFVFENVTSHPVYIEGDATGEKISFTLYGEPKKEGEKTIFKSEITSVIPQPQPQTVFDDEAFDDEKTVINGADGCTAQVRRLTYLDGKLTEDKIIRKVTYKSRRGKITVGTKKRTAE